MDCRDRVCVPSSSSSYSLTGGNGGINFIFSDERREDLEEREVRERMVERLRLRSSGAEGESKPAGSCS